GTSSVTYGQSVGYLLTWEVLTPTRPLKALWDVAQMPTPWSLSQVRGLTGGPSPGRTTRCRCEPVEFPVLPTRPIVSPGMTSAPWRTDKRDMCPYPVTV